MDLARASKKDTGIRGATPPSADWLIARHLKQEPLVLGQKASAGVRHLVSWSDANKAGATTPVNDVAEAFKRVYGRVAAAGACTTSGGLTTPTPMPGSSRLAPDVLDTVAGDLNALKQALPSWSRNTLDDQLDAIADLRTKASLAPPPTTQQPPAASGGGTSEGCYAAGTDDFYRRSNYMADLIVAAFQGGTRRVAVFQQGTASGDSFSVPGYGGYHGEVHNLNDGKVGDLNRVTKMQIELFKDIGYFVDRLGSTRDMTGQSLLDSTLVYICTEFSPYSGSSDPHNTGGGMVVNLIGASGEFDTSGKAISAKGSVGGVLVHAAQFMGLAVGTGLGANDIGKFAPLTGIRRVQWQRVSLRFDPSHSTHRDDGCRKACVLLQVGMRELGVVRMSAVVAITCIDARGEIGGL